MTFRPLPFLGNPHVQTILGVMLRGPNCPPPQHRHLVRFSDGDALILHENRPRSWLAGQPMALLVHGLTGSHLSPHNCRMAVMLLARGVRVFRADLRGAGLGLPLARGSYHAGRSEDLREALGVMHGLSPLSPLLLMGVSLGGNMCLKLAGEAAERPVPGLTRVAALNPPIDLEACVQCILHPRNRLYERRFRRDLVRDALLRQKYFPDLTPLRFPKQLNICQFDDHYTAPRNGFVDALDYYRRSSAFSFVPHSPVPTFILTSRDDPLVNAEPFDRLHVPDHIKVTVMPYGGHVGFVGPDGAGGIRWAERQIVDWLMRV